MLSRSALPAFDHHSVQSPEMIPEGLLPHVMEPVPPLVVLEKKLGSQNAELEQLYRDNRILIASHMRLVNNVAAAGTEADKLREHIRNIQTDGDMEVRIILDRYSKIEADMRAGDTLRNDIQEAHKDAQCLVTEKMELSAKIERATKELQKARADVENIPRMHVQLDSLRQEHLKLRKTFEYEKGVNTVKVEQMRRLEKDLVVVAEEVERLRVRLSEAERSSTAAVPYGCPRIRENIQFAPPVQEKSCYADSFTGPHLHVVGGQGDGLNQNGSNECASSSRVPVAATMEIDFDNRASGGNSSDMSYDES